MAKDNAFETAMQDFDWTQVDKNIASWGSGGGGRTGASNDLDNHA